LTINIYIVICIQKVIVANTTATNVRESARNKAACGGNNEFIDHKNHNLTDGEVSKKCHTARTSLVRSCERESAIAQRLYNLI
jgi:hypothetical protein